MENSTQKTGHLSKLSDAELYQACRRASGKIHEGLREFEAYLPEVYRRRLHRRRGFGSIYEFAAKMANMSHEKVNKILRLRSNLEDKPILRGLFEQGEVGYSKIEKVVHRVTPENEELWAERLCTMSKSTLELCVQNDRLKVTPGSNSEPEKSTAKKWNHLSFPVKPEVEFKLRQMKQRLEKERGETITFNEVLEALLDGAIVEKSTPKVKVCPECVARKEQKREEAKEVTRYMPTPVKKVVEARQEEKCAFPECIKPPEIFHHTRRFALKKSHDPNFIVGLCKIHERLVHSGMVKNEEEGPETWQVRELGDEAPWWDLKTRIDRRVMEFRAG